MLEFGPLSSSTGYNEEAEVFFLSNLWENLMNRSPDCVIAGAQEIAVFGAVIHLVVPVSSVHTSVARWGPISCFEFAQFKVVEVQRV